MSKSLIQQRAIEFIGARRARSKARTNLAKLRSKWHLDYEVYYEKGDTDERSWWTEVEYALSDQIEAALIERAECNKRYRRTLRALDKLFGDGI